MPDSKIIDHLFRHHYGKMVSILTKIFGLRHLETIEDAIQDTFLNAIKSWQNKIPVNPEAWLTLSSKHRVIDLIRKLSSEDSRVKNIQSGIDTYPIGELFSQHEIEDSVLRMIFTACNPLLSQQDQIAFALKTISGFSRKEIAASLLLKEETVKKRLTRARKAIIENNITFEIPTGKALQFRIDIVLEVIYLIFNEGFHSSKKEVIIREDLCGEAIRLANCLLKNSNTANANAHALFALICFQAARLKSRLSPLGELINIKQQDRSLWYAPLAFLGHESMEQAMETDQLTHYHYEAAISAEHFRASSYDETNWDKILGYYEQLNLIENSPFTTLNMAIVQLERKEYEASKFLLDSINVSELEHRTYLYFATYAEYEFRTNLTQRAIELMDKAIYLTGNVIEKGYLKKKRSEYLEKG